MRARTDVTELNEVIASWNEVKYSTRQQFTMGFKKTLKALEILEKPEAIFNRRLQSNPYHPFNMVERNKFVLALSRKRFYIGTLTAFVSIVALITWGIVFEASQYMVFLILVGGVSAIMAWENRGHRTCVLDGERAQYVCVIGEHSVENGNFHNVYIRLKAQKHGAGEMYYYVVFNGFHLTEQKITSYSKNDKKLRVLAKRLAENLNLNYFDVKASSRDHVIRHRPVVDVPSVKNSKFNVEQPV